jgi:hypothetical protein
MLDFSHREELSLHYIEEAGRKQGEKFFALEIAPER